MTIQIGDYKVQIQAEDRILPDMPKAEATKHFLNDLSIMYDRAAEYIDIQEDLDEETRRTVSGYYRHVSHTIFETLTRKGFYGDEKSFI